MEQNTASRIVTFNLFSGIETLAQPRRNTTPRRQHWYYTRIIPLTRGLGKRVSALENAPVNRRSATTNGDKSPYHSKCPVLDQMSADPAHQFVIRIAFYWNSTNQFPDEVFAIKSALASTFIYSNFQDFLLYFLARNQLFRSPVFRSFEFQNANLIALFPFAICFFAHVTDF